MIRRSEGGYKPLEREKPPGIDNIPVEHLKHDGPDTDINHDNHLFDKRYGINNSPKDWTSLFDIFSKQS